MTPLRILAFGHEASRSGAPIIHLGWLKWAAQYPDRFRVSSLLARRGPLLADWPRGLSVKTIYRIDTGNSRLMDWLSRKFVDRPGFVVRRFRRYLARLDLKDFDVIFVNTLTLGGLLKELLPGTCPIVVHAHELAGATRRSATKQDLAVLSQLTTRWIAVSNAVRSHLVNNLGIPSECVAVVRNFLPPRDPIHVTRVQAKAHLMKLHPRLADAPWIVSVGNLGLVKDPYMFLGAASQVRRWLGRACEFIWVGDGMQTRFGRNLVRSPDARHAFFTGPASDPRIWMAAADLVLVTSTEESSSLVALEAAEVGTPIIAFSGTGGIDEFIGDGAGYLVAERTVEALTASVRFWLDRREEAAACAIEASGKLRREADYMKQCEAIAVVLESVGNNRVR